MGNFELEMKSALLNWLDAHPKMQDLFKTDSEMRPLLLLMQKAYLVGRQHEQQCMRDSLKSAGFEVK